MVEKGIHIGLGMEDYHSWKLEKGNLRAGPISCSTLKAFDKNPYAWLKSPDFKPTQAMRIGSLFDAAVTDPDTLADFVISPYNSLRTREAREWKTEQEESGKTIVTETEKIRAIKAAEIVHDHPVAGEIMDGADCQVGIVQEYGGIPAKGLIDILPAEDSDWGETLVDYKTISTGLDDDSIRQAIGKYKYHWQAAFYRTLFNKASSTRLIEDFAFIFQDVNTLEVRVITLDDDAMALGSRCVGKALENFAKCSIRGIHSRYLKTAEKLSLMPYHAMAEDEELSRREGLAK